MPLGNASLEKSVDITPKWFGVTPPKLGVG